MSDPGLERFKWAMLHVAVDDPPWNTGMAWADAVHAFPDHSDHEIDQIVKDALLALLADGYIWFFRRTGFEDEFRPRSEDEALGSEVVATVLGEGRSPDDPEASTVSSVSLSSGSGETAGGRQPPARVSLRDTLSFRATASGAERHAGLLPDEYQIFGRSD